MRVTMFNVFILLGRRREGGHRWPCQQLENRPANAFHPDNVKSHRDSNFDFLLHFIRVDRYLQQCLMSLIHKPTNERLRAIVDHREIKSLQLTKVFQGFSSRSTNTIASFLLIAGCSVLNSVRASDGVQQRSSFQLAWNFIGGEGIMNLRSVNRSREWKKLFYQIAKPR